MFALAVGGAQKLADDGEPLERQENVNKIKGSQARNVMMQKLMRRSEVRLVLLVLGRVDFVILLSAGSLLLLGQI